MRVLSIDTAGRLNTICLLDGSETLGGFVWEARDNLLRDVVLNIDQVLGGAGLALGDVDGLGVGIGPGSWTGVRVGLTVGKMLAYATEKPLCGISSLDALAYQGRKAATLLCPVVDAGRGNIYAAFYRSLGETVARKGEYYAGSWSYLKSPFSSWVMRQKNIGRRYRRHLVPWPTSAVQAMIGQAAPSR